MVKTVRINEMTVGRPAPFVLIAGPCVIEDEQTTFDIAAGLKQMTDRPGPR